MSAEDDDRAPKILLLGPEISRLWMVSEGSRQRDDRTEAGLFVTDESSLYRSFSSFVCGRTLSSKNMPICEITMECFKQEMKHTKTGDLYRPSVVSEGSQEPDPIEFVNIM